MKKAVPIIAALLMLFSFPSRGQLSATGHLERATGAFRGGIDAVTRKGECDGCG